MFVFDNYDNLLPDPVKLAKVLLRSLSLRLFSVILDADYVINICTSFHINRYKKYKISGCMFLIHENTQNHYDELLSTFFNINIWCNHQVNSSVFILNIFFPKKNQIVCQA